MSAGLEERLTELAGRCLEEMGLQLYHLEFRPSGSRSMLCLFIERGGGVNLDDCAAVSRRFGLLLDAENILPDAYVLEVSSPGLDRSLHKPEHFSRFAGHAVRITTFEPLGGRRHFTGRIVSCDEHSLRLAPEDGEEIELPYGKVAGGHLVGEI